MSERKIGLYFFIDYKKAFDMVPTNILLDDDDAIKLLSDYFKNRSQYIKIDKILSTICQVLLKVVF
jgi:hypothetical protein